MQTQKPRKRSRHIIENTRSAVVSEEVGVAITTIRRWFLETYGTVLDYAQTMEVAVHGWRGIPHKVLGYVNYKKWFVDRSSVGCHIPLNDRVKAKIKAIQEEIEDEAVTVPMMMSALLIYRAMTLPPKLYSDERLRELDLQIGAVEYGYEYDKENGIVTYGEDVIKINEPPRKINQARIDHKIEMQRKRDKGIDPIRRFNSQVTLDDESLVVVGEDDNQQQ